MDPSRRPLLVPAASVLVVLAFAVVASETRDPDVWIGVVAVYALVVLLAGGLWYRRDRPLAVPETVAIAAAVVVALAPLTPLLFVVGDSHFPGWWVVPTHLQRFVPVAFVFPLGAATTRRQRRAVGAAMLLPGLYELFDWFVLHPDQFSPFWTTPLTLVVGTGGWFVFHVAAGGPLFLLGRRLAREAGPIQQVARRRDAPETR